MAHFVLFVASAVPWGPGAPASGQRCSRRRMRSGEPKLEEVSVRAPGLCQGDLLTSGGGPCFICSLVCPTNVRLSCPAGQALDARSTLEKLAAQQLHRRRETPDRAEVQTHTEASAESRALGGTTKLHNLLGKAILRPTKPRKSFHSRPGGRLAGRQWGPPVKRLSPVLRPRSSSSLEPRENHQ